MTHVVMQKGGSWVVGYYYRDIWRPVQECESKTLALEFSAWMNGGGGTRPPTTIAEARARANSMESSLLRLLDSVGNLAEAANGGESAAASNLRAEMRAHGNKLLGWMKVCDQGRGSYRDALTEAIEVMLGEKLEGPRPSFAWLMRGFGPPKLVEVLSELPPVPRDVNGEAIVADFLSDPSNAWAEAPASAERQAVDKGYARAPEGLVDPLQLRHYYIGAVALLARLSGRSWLTAEDKMLMSQCVRDCAGNFPGTFEAVETPGGGAALEPRTGGVR